MGITLGTALEMYTNPFDLSFAVSKDFIAVSRGPGHSFKLLFDGAWKLESQEKAAEELKVILTGIVSVSENELRNPKSVLAAMLNPEGKSLTEAEVLTPGMVEEIARLAAAAGNDGIEIGTYRAPFSRSGKVSPQGEERSA